MKTYGYCRISRKSQNIQRQVRNIEKAYPDAIILKEAFTGTKILGRKELDKIIKYVEKGDTVVFDSASRMSRNADEAIELYEFLFNKDVNLIFLKEPHINSEVYKQALQNQIQINLDTGNKATDELINSIVEALNVYTIALAKDQIRLVFAQAQKEVDDLHQRTKEGIETARLNGKQIGSIKGEKKTTKKSITAKEQIKKYNNTFGGRLTNEETWQKIGISKMTFYKYKRELLEEIAFN